MTTRRRLAACLLVCGLVGPIAAGTGLGAEPSPKPLWELYPLDPTEGDARERPAITTETTRPSPRPRSGVAGVRTTKPDGTVTARSTVATRDRSDDDGTSVVFGLVLGGLAAAIVLLLLAVVPPRAALRRAGLRADRRLDMVLAGVVALLVVTIVYLSGVS